MMAFAAGNVFTTGDPAGEESPADAVPCAVTKTRKIGRRNNFLYIFLLPFASGEMYTLEAQAQNDNAPQDVPTDVL
jgi:hypothetical protein